MESTACFLLCAGLGTRLRPLTNDIPKCLLEINNKPVIEHIIDNLKKHGITNYCINTYYKPDKLLQFASRNNIKVYPETTLKGTAGALVQAKEWLSGNFIVANSDTLTNIDYQDMLQWHKDNKSLVTIFTKSNEPIHSGGTYIFNKEVFKYIPKNKPYSIHESLIPLLIQKVPNQIGLYNDPDATYLDIGTNISNYMKAQREWEKYE